MAPETALSIPDLLTSLDAEPTQQLGRHAIVVALSTVFGPVRIGPRRVTDPLQLDNPSLEVGIAHFSETILNGLIQPSQLGFRVRSLLPQLGDPTLQVFSVLLPALKQASEQLLKSLGSKKSLLQMRHHQRVQLIHRDRAAAARRLPLPCRRAACVVAVLVALARGAECHGSPAIGTEAHATEERPGRHEPRGLQLRAARAHHRLHLSELLLVDDRLDRHVDDLVFRLLLSLTLARDVETMATDVGLPGQDLVDRADAPAPAGLRPDTARV
ncbi:hypothetical protein ADL19_24425 [Streptomyces purpurogeneiscleroticus]|nr:hypothetical protein ADL19_24425 [Streptomyces purpurogeneiscleroticus]